MTDIDVHSGGFREGAGRKPIPDRVRILNFGSMLASPKSSRYKCGHTIHFRLKSNTHKNLALTMYCNSWACLRCNKHNKKKWMDHILAMTISGATGAWSNQAYIFETSDGNWKSSVKKQLTRKNVDFIRIRLHDGRLVIINNGGFGELLSGDHFISGLEKIFAAVGYGRKPVFTSKRWQLGTKVASFQWERLNYLHLTLPQLNEELAKRRIHREFLSLDKDGIIFQYPDSWTEDNIEEFIRHLTNSMKDQ